MTQIKETESNIEEMLKSLISFGLMSKLHLIKLLNSSKKFNMLVKYLKVIKA